MRRGRPPYAGTLTPREQEVMALLREGLTNPEIAERMGISLDGAKYHVSEILSKLEVGSREEAAAWQPSRPAFGFGLAGVALKKLSLEGLMRTTTVALLAGGVGAIALIAAGVFVMQSRADGDAGPVARAPAPLTPSDRESAFLNLASYVPATGDGASYSLQYSDYVSARALVGSPSPDPRGDEDAIRNDWATLSDEASVMAPSLPSSFATLPHAWNGEIGINIASVDEILWAGGPVVTRGRFDAAEVESAITTTSRFKDGVSVETHLGLPFFTWGRDASDEAPRTAAGGLWPAAMGRLTTDGDILAWAFRTDVMESMIDASRRETRSLADERDVQLLADAFLDLGVHTAWVTIERNAAYWERAWELVRSEYGRNDPGFEARMEGEGFLVPYYGVAVGAGNDGESAYAVLILLHDTAEAAAVNATMLRSKIASGTRFQDQKPWREYVTSSQIEAKGTVVEARLDTTTLRLTLFGFNNLESLFVFR